MSVSKELLNYVSDGDMHTKLDRVEYSTSLREIVTVGYMMQHYVEDHPVEDFSGTEIQSGDNYFEIGGNIILVENIEDFLIEHLGAKLYKAV